MITILGATGNVGKKIVDILTKRGEKLRMVARSADRLRPFVGKQSSAMAGDALDTEFLVQAFRGSDAAFTLIPPNLRADNYIQYGKKIGESIARALELSGVSHVVNLSSVGAELTSGTGAIVTLHEMEERLSRINGINIVHLRAAFFMENLLANIEEMRSSGTNSSPYKGDQRFPMIATKDVAECAAELLAKRDFTGSSVRSLLGKKEISMKEATEIIGKRIGKPQLVYEMLPYDKAENWLVTSGISPDVSKLYIEMSKALNDGLIKAEKRSPENTTRTTFEEFCDEIFVPLYRERQPEAA